MKTETKENLKTNFNTRNKQKCEIQNNIQKIKTICWDFLLNQHFFWYPMNSKLNTRKLKYFKMIDFKKSVKENIF